MLAKYGKNGTKIMRNVFQKKKKQKLKPRRQSIDFMMSDLWSIERINKNANKHLFIYQMLQVRVLAECSDMCFVY